MLRDRTNGEAPAMRRRDLLGLASAAAVWPLAARGQQKAMPVIGYLGSASPGPPPAAFHGGLGEAGYVEGQNVTIEVHSAEGNYERLPALAANLVGRNVDVIVAALQRKQQRRRPLPFRSCF